MPPKIFWVISPLLLHALYLLWQFWRGKPITRFGLNLQLSLMLMLYLFVTAGLGIFWVANQQLPVFDIHYLFGYATLFLLGLHLYFNLPLVWRYWRKPRTTNTASVTLPAIKLRLPLLLLFFACLLIYWLTLPQKTPSSTQWLNQKESDAQQFVQRFHEFSSSSRSNVFARAASIDWGKPVAEFKDYPHLPKVALRKSTSSTYSLHAALRGNAVRSKQLSRAELGQILFLANGITAKRNGYSLRAAPSSGALFPAEVYVAVRQVDGVAAGLYHYDPRQEELSRLSENPQLAGAPQAATAEVVVIVSAMMRRTGVKYGDRAYRYASADIGHLLENLRLAGHSLGMQSQAMAQFDETSVAQSLGLDATQENVLAMLELRQSEIQRPPATAFTPATSGESSASLGVSGLIHQATSLRLSTPRQTTGQIIALQATAQANMPVFQVIQQRRSQRRFSEQAIPLASLAAILQDMAQTPVLSDAIGINLVVNRVNGLAAGVYRYLPQQGLLLVREGEFAKQAQEAALQQDVIGDAAVVLVLSVRREAMFAQGARGYRHAFLEAGMLGERWLLSAVARNLAACPVGAFYDDEAASLISVNPAQEWVLHFAALGILAK